MLHQKESIFLNKFLRKKNVPKKQNFFVDYVPGSFCGAHSGPRGFVAATLGKQTDVRAGEPKGGLWPFFILKGGECPPFGGCLACVPPVQFYLAEGETGLVLITPSYRGPARSLFIQAALWQRSELERGRESARFRCGGPTDKCRGYSRNGSYPGAPFSYLISELEPFLSPTGPKMYLLFCVIFRQLADVRLLH